MIQRMMALAMWIAGAFACALVCVAQGGVHGSVVLPAHTRVVVQTRQAVRVSQMKAGDTVALLVRRPVRAGDVLVVPSGTPVTARVVADPQGGIAYRVDPLRVGDVDVALEGKVLPVGGDALDEKDEWMPQELRYGYWRPAPYRGSDAGNDPKDLVPAGVISELRTAGDVTFAAGALPREDRDEYRGDPLLFVSDRLREKHGRVLCGTQGVLGEHHPDPAVLRVAPGTYVLHTDRAGEASVTVKAERNQRYLIYHDEGGLDAVALDRRPALLDYMPRAVKAEDFFFDADALTGADAAAVERDRAGGGCGWIKTLHRPRGGTSKR